MSNKTNWTTMITNFSEMKDVVQRLKDGIAAQDERISKLENQNHIDDLKNMQNEKQKKIDYLLSTTMTRHDENKEDDCDDCCDNKDDKAPIFPVFHIERNNIC